MKGLLNVETVARRNRKMTGIISLIICDDAREYGFLGEIRNKIYCEPQIWGGVVEAEDEKAINKISRV